jgi:ABC-type nitrate/sulfonate/bicarbonate transport system substrate-binding protein
MWKPILAATMLAMAIGCPERRAPPTVEPVTIEVAMMPHFSLVLVAQAKGYFRDQGLAVTLQPHPFGKMALAALLDGKGDLATCAETPVVFAELGGQPLAILASIGSSRKNTAVVALKEAGITTPGDLKGKRIGVSRGTSGDFFLDTFLLRHGVDRRDVLLVDLAPAEMSEALASRRIDAAATWNPTALLLQRRFGEEVQSFFEGELYTETLLIVGRRDFAEQRPEAAKRVLRALLEAEVFFRTQPAEARRAAASALGDDPGILDALLPLFDFRVRLDQSLLGLMEEQQRWATRVGLVPPRASFNFLPTFAADPLHAVKPEAVGLVR